MDRQDKALCVIAGVLGYVLYRIFDTALAIRELDEVLVEFVEERNQVEFDQQFEEIIDENDLGDQFP